MSTLTVKLHPKASAELSALAKSTDPLKKEAAAQLLNLMQLIRSHPTIRDRLLGHFEELWVVLPNQSRLKVDIKIIKELQSIADDKYLTDAIRRIRNVNNKPADQYRVFYVQRMQKQNGTFVCEILGVFERAFAYSPAALTELKSRYEK